MSTLASLGTMGQVRLTKQAFRELTSTLRGKHFDVMLLTVFYCHLPPHRLSKHSWRSSSSSSSTTTTTTSTSTSTSTSSSTSHTIAASSSSSSCSSSRRSSRNSFSTSSACSLITGSYTTSASPNLILIALYSQAKVIFELR